MTHTCRSLVWRREEEIIELMSPRHIKTPSSTKKTQWKIGENGNSSPWEADARGFRVRLPAWATYWVLDQSLPHSKVLSQNKQKQRGSCSFLYWHLSLCTMPSAGSVRWTDSCTRGQATWARLLCSVTLPVRTLIPTWPHTSQPAPGDFVHALGNAYLPESHWTIEN